MKKITLKFMLFAIAVISFQFQAQITEGTKYTLQNAETGQFLQANGSGQYIFADAVAEGDNTFNFTFWHHNTINPGEDGQVGTEDDVVNNFTDDWNIQGDVRGILRAGAGNGVGANGTTHTNFRYNVWNSNGGHKTDKRWIAVPVDLGGLTAYRFQAVVSGDENPRFLMQGIAAVNDNLLFNLSDADLESDATTVTDVVVSDGKTNRSLWVLAEVVLSNDKFDASSVFVSNPVNDQLTIKDADAKISQVSIYSILGSKVLSKTINNQSVINFDVSSLASGMYIVKIKGDGGTFTKKIIKE